MQFSFFIGALPRCPPALVPGYAGSAGSNPVIEPMGTGRHQLMEGLSMNLITRTLAICVVALPIATTGVAKAADIVDTAISAGSFNTLVAAVQAAELVDTLKSEGPFTVFAPTDEAFAKLPPGTVENLLKPENKDQLVAVLTYHVIPGKVMAEDVIGKRVEAATVQGSNVVVAGISGVYVNNNAKVIQADVEASNGVIHVIDRVILPPQ
jgi:uncharacterized surface protein with fasciclin (FAS1) repeats